MSLTKNKLRTGLVLLIFLAFIALGLPDSLMGVGWPSIRAGFSVPLDALGLLMIASTTGYIFSSFTSGFLISRLGVGGLLAASCALTGASLIGYTLVPAWGFMVFLGIFAGLGAGAIDSGLNAYAAENFSEGLMQWLHASYGIGITMGPIIMTFALSSSNSWRLGYDVVAAVQLLLAAAFVLTLPLWSRKPEIKEIGDAEKKEKRLTEFKTPIGSSIKQPAVWISVALFFIYTGSEVALGAWAYTLLTESRGIDPHTGRVLGRQLLGYLYRRAHPGRPVCQTSGAAHIDTGQLLPGAAGIHPLMVEPLKPGQPAWNCPDRVCYRPPYSRP